MTLTIRLLAFFLTTLAVVLIGFSTAVCFIANRYLFGQVEERLDAALNTLCAAAEIDSTGVDWELEERQLKLNPAGVTDRFVWYVLDDQNNLIDGKDVVAGIRWSGSPEPADQGQSEQVGLLLDNFEDWKFKRRRLTTMSPTVRPDLTPPNVHDPHKYAALEIGIGLSLEPTRTLLRRLVGLTVALSIGLWAIALLAGRAICRRALRPIIQMATVANDINVDDLTRRLPTSTSGDELDVLGQSFNNLLGRLQESFERQRRFTGDASHQLRTPIASILGQADVALRRARSSDEYEQVLNTIRQQARNLERIVESLLFLARADTEAQIDRLDRIEVGTLFGELRKTWLEHRRRADIQFLVVDGGSLTVRIQPVLFAELMNILIDNACKFSQPGTPILVRSLEDQADILIEVQDCGYGILESDISQVFNPFFRSRETLQRGIEGTGLGLSIANRLALTMGGTLTVTSQSRQGSCFSLRLPIAND